MRRVSPVSSTMVNLYYQDLEEAVRFWTHSLGFPIAVDQGWAKLLCLREGSFLGLVDGRRGYHRPQEENAILITLITDDLEAWHARVQEAGAREVTAIEFHPELQIERFFCRDPGGYTLEFQRFLRPEDRALFHT